MPKPEQPAADWLPVLVLGPLFPSMFALVVLSAGQYVLATTDVACDAAPNLHVFVRICVVLSYLVLGLFSWTLAGRQTEWMGRQLTKPVTSLLWLGRCWAALAVLSTLTCAAGAMWVVSSLGFCRGELWTFSAAVVGVYWSGFVCVLPSLLGMGRAGARAHAGVDKRIKHEAGPDDDVEAAGREFDKYDSSGDGTISAEELAELMGALGLEMEPHQARDVAAELDTSGDGWISRREFIMWYLEARESEQGGGGNDI